jgi:hypothetical protein
VALLSSACLITALVLAAVPEWEPLSKGAAMKALFVTVFAGMLAALAVMAYADQTPVSTGIQSPLSSDDDKDKDKDKDKKDG